MRLLLQLRGETIELLDTHIGLLHRGSEFLIESKNYIKGLPYFDRLDYVSMMSQEHAYCLAIESLLNNKKTYSIVSIVRTLFDELTRLLNHLLAISCHALDVGSMSSIFWAFEERENLMEFYERVSGARMHAAFYRPNTFNFFVIKDNFLLDILKFIKKFYITINEINNVLTYNKIWKQRLVNIGTIIYNHVNLYNLTGVMLRSVGVKKDIRLLNSETYANYFYLNFKSYISYNGDSYDRFLIRMSEINESLNIITQCIFILLNKNKTFIFKNFYNTLNNFNYNNIQNSNNFISMENLITHFKNWHGNNLNIKKNLTSQTIESPKGEFGVKLVSDNSNKPFRCKIKSPAYFHLNYLKILSKGHFLADLATLIGTIDIVFGEIDR